MSQFDDYFSENQCQSYLINEDSSQLIRCNNSGIRRADNGLESGIHCDICWEKLILECRQRSW